LTLFKIDENLRDEVAEFLVREGHDAMTVHAEGLRGCVDPVLTQHCLNEGRALVTLDLDFADIRAFPPTTGAGIIVLRVHEQSRANVMRAMPRIADLLKREPLAGRLWIVTDAGVRIRGA
jgi:predicted nuclease of predicted toxin-antitoxin system